MEERITAIAVSDGIAYAPVRLIVRDSGEYVPRYSVGEELIAREQCRLDTALQDAAEALDHVIALVAEQVGLAQANIFQAQKMLVLDAVLADEVKARIRSERVNAESACVDILDRYESRLLAVDNEYLKDRASDIGEVRRRILEMFRRERGDTARSAEEDSGDGEARVVVAEELLPGDTVRLNAQNTAAFLTERGGPGSHAAILARAMGIPAVSGIGAIFQSIHAEDRVLVNGTSGEVIINPGPRTLDLYPALRRTTPSRLLTVPAVPGFAVYANISTVDDLAGAVAMGAEGIGLYRTEFEFISADRILSEDEQHDRYRQVVRAMAGAPVYIRLADLGGDKAARFLRMPKEDNPALGFRGARLLLGRPEVLRAQARAIARASQEGPVRVIYPMVTDEQQFLKLRTLFLQSIQDLPAGELRHGVMFEVPAACICAESLLRAADFGCIGTNDLVQYLFAVDRDNGLVASDYDPDRPAFWVLLRMMVDAAARLDRPLSLCGEMGGQPKFLPRLIASGIRCVSVTPRLIGTARFTARRVLRAQAPEDPVFGDAVRPPTRA